MNIYEKICGIYTNNDISNTNETFNFKYFFVNHEGILFKTDNFAFFQNIFHKFNRYQDINNYLKSNFKFKKIKLVEVNSIKKNAGKFKEEYFKVNINNKTRYIFSFDDNKINLLHDFFSKINIYLNNKEFIKKYLDDRIDFFPVLNWYNINLENYINNNLNKLDWMKIKNRSKAKILKTEENNKLIKLNNNSLYNGDINENEEPHGNGKEFLQSDNIYFGNFKDGLWHGKGYITNNKNNKICYGEFIDGKIRGI